MKFSNKTPLADVHGQPLNERIQEVLHDLLPRFRSTFSMIRDEAVLTNLLEIAGQKIAAQERARGPIDRLHAYAWTVLKHLAISKLRESDQKVQQASIGSMEGEVILERLATNRDGPENTERKTLVAEALRQLTEREREIAILKKAEFSSDEIGRYLQISSAAVDQIYFRAKHKLRKLLNSDAGPE